MAVTLVIKASTGKTVDRLIDDLWTGDALRRDAAVARLIVIGERALQRLLGVAADSDAASEVKVAAFRALEGIGNPKALAPALDAIVSGDSAVSAAATAVAKAMLHTAHGIAALDRLTALALDEDRPTAIRVAAARALSDLDPRTVQPVFAALSESANEAVAAEAQPGQPGAPAQPSDEELVRQASEGRLPDDPDALRRALAAEGSRADVQALLGVVEQVRIREGAESAERKRAWRTARATAHRALAERGSHLALFDLRETIAGAKEPLPVELLHALLEIGDASCLEAVAAADAGAAASGLASDDWWRRQLTELFRTIATREGITRRHQVARKIEKRWPGSFQRMVKGF